MIYTNSTTNYTNIDAQKISSLRWNTGHMQSIAGPVHASAVLTDKKKNNTKLFL